MDEALFRRVKLEAVRQGRPLNAILEDALTSYLAGSQPTGSPYLSVADTWGAMALPPDVLREIMEEDDDDFDS